MDVAITGPEGGDAIQFGPIRMRILEDGSTPTTAWGWARSPCRPTPTARLSTATPVMTRGSTWCPVPLASRWGRPPTTRPPAPWSWSRRAPRTPSPTPAMTPRVAEHLHPRPLRAVFPRFRDMIAAGQPLTPETTGKAMARYATVPATHYAD